MSPTKRTRKTEQAKSRGALRAKPAVPEVISAPSVTEVPAVVNLPSLAGKSAAGAGAAKESAASACAAHPDDQRTAPLSAAPGLSIVEQARLARGETQPLSKIEGGTAIAAAVSAHEASAGNTESAAPKRPSVKAKVEKQRAVQERSAAAASAAAGGAAAAASAAAGGAAAGATAPGASGGGAAARSSATSDTTNASGNPKGAPTQKASRDSKRESVRESTKHRASEQAKRGSGTTGEADKEHVRNHTIFRTPDGKRPLWFKITLIVLAALFMLTALVALVFAWTEWGRADDAYDIQGSWNIDGGTSPITISGDKITLSKDATYSYALDTGDKTITFSFVNRQGGGHYRFSLDRTQFAVIECNDASSMPTIWDDFTWCVQAYAALLFRGEMLSPAPPDEAKAESGESQTVTVLLKVEGTSAETVKAQASSTPSIVIDRTTSSKESATSEGESTPTPEASANGTTTPSSSPAATSGAER